MDVLLILLSIGIAGALAFHWIWSRQQINELQRQLGQLPVKQEQLSSAMNASQIGLGQRLLKLEKELEALSIRVEQSELHVVNNGSTYNQAINLIRRGVDTEELMEICDLSRSEAELLITLHRKDEAREEDKGAAYQASEYDDSGFNKLSG